MTGTSEPELIYRVASTSRPLKMLTERQIRQIDEALAALGPFAEVRLIKEKGRLRFIKKVESVVANS